MWKLEKKRVSRDMDAFRTPHIIRDSFWPSDASGPLTIVRFEPRIGVFTRKFGKQAQHVIKAIACEVTSRLPQSPITKQETLPINVHHDSPLTYHHIEERNPISRWVLPESRRIVLGCSSFLRGQNCDICRDYSEMWSLDIQPTTRG